MTETLKNTLHDRASAPSFDPVDLAAIRRDGARTVRRRRAGVAVGGAVAAGAVVASLVVSLGGGDDGTDGVPVAVDPGTTSTAEVTWVEGSTLHRAVSGDLDLGREAVAYVRTSVGFVFADAEGAVFSTTGGEATQVGSTDADAISLVSDPARPVAAWLDSERSGIVTYDQASGADLTLEDRVVGRDPRLTALDGTTAYLDTGGRARRIDLVDGTVSTVEGPMGPVLDASGDLVAIDTNGQGVVFSDAGSTTVVPQTYSSDGTFSPDGAWFSGDADETDVFDTTTLERLSFDSPTFFATGYEWLDDETLVMIASESKGSPAQLLTCAVPEGTCETTVELDTFEAMEQRGFVFPFGEPVDY